MSTPAATTTPSSSPPHSAASSPPPQPSPAAIREAVASLSTILPTPLPHSLLSDPSPMQLLHDPDVATQISALLRDPSSGSGDDPLCCWLYNNLQLSPSPPPLLPIVLRHLPALLLLYLSRPSPSPGFEAVLLAVYSHVSTARANQLPVRVTIPDLTTPSIYHEEATYKPSDNMIATPLNLTILYPNLEPYGTVRSTRRARIVGVALELYFSRVSEMPAGSKLDFCELCEAFSDPRPEEGGGKAARLRKVTLQWEILQPMLRILGHCLMAPNNEGAVVEAAYRACWSLYSKALNSVDAKAILATESLVRLGRKKLEEKECNDIDDPTEIARTDIIVIN